MNWPLLYLYQYLYLYPHLPKNSYRPCGVRVTEKWHGKVFNLIWPWITVVGQISVYLSNYGPGGSMLRSQGSKKQFMTKQTMFYEEFAK